MTGTGHSRHDIGRSTGAVAAQATAAGGSFILQVIAVRVLSPAGYGRFTIVFGTLVLSAAIHGGFVGDARTVLDRSDPVIRGTLLACQMGLTGLAAVVTTGVAAATGRIGTTGTLLMGVLTALWLFEDAGRRLFMTRLEFGRLVVNDLVYLVVALLGLSVMSLRDGGLGLDELLAAMSLGAAAAVAHAAWKLPGSELAGGHVTRAGVREVVGFGMWRSAHAGVRPLATLLLRAAISAITSAGALGRLEAARLAVAPMLIITNGVGSYLLPRAAHRQREAPESPERLGPVVAALVAVGIAYGIVAVSAAGIIVPFLTGGDDAIDRLAIAGWSLFAVAFAAGIPAGTALVARRRSGLVFRLRAVDSVVGLAMAVVLATLVDASAAPFGLAVGAALGAVLLWPYAVRPDPRPSPGLVGGPQ